MDQNKEFSKAVYGVETGKVIVNEKIVEDKYLVIDVIDTDKHTIGKEKHQSKTVCRTWLRFQSSYKKFNKI